MTKEMRQARAREARRNQRATARGVRRQHHNARQAVTASSYPLNLTTAPERFHRYIAEAAMKGLLHRPHRPRCADPCLIWPGAPCPTTGYGRLDVVSQPVSTKILAHVLAARLYLLDGGPIPEGMQVNHTCDAKLCVNYRHLYIGTHGDNMADLRHRGSWARQLEQERRLYRNTPAEAFLGLR